MKKLLTLFSIVFLTCFSAAAQETLFSFGSTWKYLDNGSNQGTAWRTLSFDDSGWKTGDGKFGYGITDANTQIVSNAPGSNNKYVTTYFRKTISISDASTLGTITANMKFDDGLVIYVNDVEVVRKNMPIGTFAYNTLATVSAEKNGSNIVSQTFGSAAFVSGNNVIAVEVHQQKLRTSDMAFDLELKSSGGASSGDQTAPSVSSINRQNPTESTTSATQLTFRATFSEKVQGVGPEDFTLAATGSAVGSIGSVTALNADNAIYDVQVTGVAGSGSLRLDLVASGTGIQDEAGNAISGGYSSGQVYTIEQPPTDQTAPVVSSINRQAPTETTTSATQLTFRATFSEKVQGVSADDFALTATGSAAGTVGSVTAVNADNIAFDVQVTGVTGEGSLRLDLKASGTGIQDAAGNAMAGGYTGGQTYTIQKPTTQPGTVTTLNPVSISKNTAEKPQSKTWTHAGKQWAVLSSDDNSYLYRLDGTSWTRMLQVYSSSARADCKKVGDLTHILLFRGGSTSYLVTIEYVPAAGTYQLWRTQPNRVALSLDANAETATLDVDGNGRMWIANDNPSAAEVRWSDSPYTNWSSPIAVASNISSDDICAVIAMPGKIGVMWSNQNAKRFGFSTHANGTDPSAWTNDENPASQSAISKGSGFADDHLNLKVASDGTLYCAAKTGYDTPGYAKIILLVRRPSGTWDNAYTVTTEGTYGGTRGIVTLNEAVGKVRVFYTSHEDGGDILYKESSTGTISFGSSHKTLIEGIYNNVTGAKDPYNPETVVLASSTTQAVGWLFSDAASTATASVARVANAFAGSPAGNLLSAYPNPFSGGNTVSFTLPQGGEYTVALYDGNGLQIQVLGKGVAQAGETNTTYIDGTSLPEGLYLVRLETRGQVKSMKLIRTSR